MKFDKIGTPNAPELWGRLMRQGASWPFIPLAKYQTKQNTYSVSKHPLDCIWLCDGVCRCSWLVWDLTKETWGFNQKERSGGDFFFFFFKDWLFWDFRRTYVFKNVKEKPQFTKVKLRSENFYFHKDSGFIFVQKGILSSGLVFQQQGNHWKVKSSPFLKNNTFLILIIYLFTWFWITYRFY